MSEVFTADGLEEVYDFENIRFTEEFIPPSWKKDTSRMHRIEDVILYLINLAMEGDEDFFDADGSVEFSVGCDVVWYILATISYIFRKRVYTPETYNLDDSAYREDPDSYSYPWDLAEGLRQMVDDILDGDEQNSVVVSSLNALTNLVDYKERKAQYAQQTLSTITE